MTSIRNLNRSNSCDSLGKRNKVVVNKNSRSNTSSVSSSNGSTVSTNDKIALIYSSNCTSSNCYCNSSSNNKDVTVEI